MNPFQALHVIEILRCGVSSRHVARVFSYGREALIDRVQRELEEVANGPSSRSLIIRGEYGEGKTHLLNLIADTALEQNFAVSFVVLSRETPFNRLDQVYPKLVAETFLPGVSDPGIEPLLRDLRPGGRLTAQLLEFAQNNLHPKIACVLTNFFETADSYHAHLLLNDLSGNWLPLPQLRSLNRLNFGRTVAIRFSARQNAWDYFRFLAHLIRLRGLAGWVILIDEFELVGTLGAGARAEAYYNMGRFVSPEPAEALEGTLAVFSIASSFWPLRLLAERQPDTESIPTRWLAKGEPKKAEQVRRTLNTLLQAAVPLEQLSGEQVRQMLTKIIELHAEAYSWQPQIDLNSVLVATKHSRLRTKIRYMLDYLDLLYLYGEVPQIATRELVEASLQEIGEDHGDEPSLF